MHPHGDLPPLTLTLPALNPSPNPNPNPNPNQVTCLEDEFQDFQAFAWGEWVPGMFPHGHENADVVGCARVRIRARVRVRVKG